MKLKRKQPRTSTVLLFSIIVFIFGLYLVSYNYLVGKKDKVYSSMNLLLYEDETPKKVSDNKSLEVEDEEVDPNTNEKIKVTYSYIGTLEIPKLKLNKGFLNIDSPYNNVDRNVTVINNSTYPDEENSNLILAAHSGNCSICFFDKLYKLSLKDKATINYKGYKYTYVLKDIYNVKKTGKVEIRRNKKKTVLTLITCTHNSDTEQTVYIFELDKKEKK